MNVIAVLVFIHSHAPILSTGSFVNVKLVTKGIPAQKVRLLRKIEDFRNFQMHNPIKITGSITEDNPSLKTPIME